MNPREKVLAIGAFVATAVLLVAFVLMRVIIAPTEEFRKQADKVAIDIDKYETKNRMKGVYVDTIVESTRQSYGADESTALEMSRAHLVKLIAKAGLAGDDLSMTPVTGKSVKGGREVGWVIRVKGPVDRLTNFLYVINADPHLHKLDNITWTPIAGSTDLTLAARFVTLVLEPIQGMPPVQISPESMANTVVLDSPQRRWYGLISERDIFRPYIKRPPAPQVVSRPPQPRNDAPRTAPPPRTPTPTHQLVGLPTWNDEPEVVVKDSRQATSTIYKIGEDFLGGEIVMVDYRPLPLPKKPEIISTSRVIVRVGRDYWAVELGQYLTDKYLLTGSRLPESLRGSQPASAPVTPASGASTSDSTDTGLVPSTGSEPVSQEAGHAP